MSVTAAMRRLLAAGFTLEQALAAAEAFEAEMAPQQRTSVEADVTERQARNARYYQENRLRMKAEREAAKASEIQIKASEKASEMLEQDVSDAETTEAMVEQKEKSPDPYKKNTNPSDYPSGNLFPIDEIPAASVKPKAKPHPIPSDFEPSTSDFSIIEAGGVDRRSAESQVIVFRNYWLGRAEDNHRDAKAKKVNWGRAFQNWCLSNHNKGRSAESGSRYGPQPSGKRNPFFAAIQRDRTH